MYNTYIQSRNINENRICIPTTFTNPLKAFVSNKKYHFAIKTHTTQCILCIFRILKIIGVQNQLPITFC